MRNRRGFGRWVCGGVLLVAVVAAAPGWPRRLGPSPASGRTLRTVPKVAFALLIIKLIIKLRAVLWFYGWRKAPGNVHHNNKLGHNGPGQPPARLIRRQVIQKLLNNNRDLTRFSHLLTRHIH